MLLCGCSRFPFPLATCIYYLFLISGLFTLALAGDIAFFYYHRVHNIVFNACMHVVCMYVKYTFVGIPHRDIYHTLSGMVRSINTIFQDNAEQYVIYVVLQVSKDQILEALHAAPRETVGPRTLSTFTPLQYYWNTK